MLLTTFVLAAMLSRLPEVERHCAPCAVSDGVVLHTTAMAAVTMAAPAAVLVLAVGLTDLPHQTGLARQQAGGNSDPTWCR
jgi:hypothetical protein